MSPLPPWVTITVMLSLTAVFIYNVVAAGPDGYPTSVIIGGLIGTYIGGQELAKRGGRDRGRHKGGDET